MRPGPKKNKKVLAAVKITPLCPIVAGPWLARDFFQDRIVSTSVLKTIRRFACWCLARQVQPTNLLTPKILDHRRHALDLRLGQLGENRQAQALASGLFRVRKITGLMAQAGVTFLQMQRQRIIDRKSTRLNSSHL